jgi:hypothetical protein
LHRGKPLAGLDARHRQRHGVAGDQVRGHAEARREDEAEEEQQAEAHDSRLDAAG